MPGFALILAQDGDWDHMEWGTGWGVLMLAGMVLFWGIVILGVVWLVHELGRRRDGEARRTPLEVLDHRLADGEITPQEYEKRRRLLARGP